MIPQASRLAEEDKQKKTHTHTGLYPQAMIHRDTGEWVSSSEGPLTLSPSPCHLSPCPGPFFHHPFPGWPPPWILSLQPILTGQFCGSLQSPTGDPALSLCLCIFHAPQCCHTLSKLVSRTQCRLFLSHIYPTLPPSFIHSCIHSFIRRHSIQAVCPSHIDGSLLTNFTFF